MTHDSFEMGWYKQSRWPECAFSFSSSENTVTHPSVNEGPDHLALVEVVGEAKFNLARLVQELYLLVSTFMCMTSVVRGILPQDCAGAMPRGGELVL
ncbi:hypothetical protein SBV1_1610012 [Verrucomicrobia bacterium]|nr:hypothetical protein SBV1_1610012 [Verrucomicrobiota bacterium]